MLPAGVDKRERRSCLVSSSLVSLFKRGPMNAPDVLSADPHDGGHRRRRLSSSAEQPIAVGDLFVVAGGKRGERTHKKC